MNGQVLVLNANFEPINVCDTRRALGLIGAGKAAIIVNGRGFVHTVSHYFPRPSVIRLESMIQRPRPWVKLTRGEVFRRDNYTCQYCGRQAHTLTIDHVIPRHLGGGHTWTNVVAACAVCNHNKGGRRLDEARMSLARTPMEPPASLVYLFSHYLQENGEWVPFVEGW